MCIHLFLSRDRVIQYFIVRRWRCQATYFQGLLSGMIMQILDLRSVDDDMQLFRCITYFRCCSGRSTRISCGCQLLFLQHLVHELMRILQDMATRILAGWCVWLRWRAIAYWLFRYLLGQDQDYPAVNFDSKDSDSPYNQHVNVQGDHARLDRARPQTYSTLIFIVVSSERLELHLLCC